MNLHFQLLGQHVPSSCVEGGTGLPLSWSPLRPLELDDGHRGTDRGSLKHHLMKGIVTHHDYNCTLSRLYCRFLTVAGSLKRATLNYAS